MGRGGYVTYASPYYDSGGHKVIDKGAIFVAERYIDLGYEAVFRRQHQENPNVKSCDLTIKSSDDKRIFVDIEVKRVTSPNPSKMASEICGGFEQVKTGETVAVFLPKLKKDEMGLQFAREGYEEAKRKKNVNGTVEVWFSDKTRIVFPWTKEK